MIWCVLSVLCVAALYLFLIAPNVFYPNARTPSFGGWAYAHRGLHGKDAPENSLTAFKRAADKGYGIELDVHLSADRVMVVHHDDSLLRLCGRDQKIQDLTWEEIRQCRLDNTQERIPSLDQVLDAVNGRVPMIIEMKTGPKAWKTLPEMLYKRMRHYHGMYCVESFDPRMLRWYKKHAPDVVRGQLAFDPSRIPNCPYHGALVWLGAHLWMNCVSRPDFVAYGHESAGNFSFRMMRTLFAPVLAAWTVRSKEDFEKLKKEYRIQIFEGFEP